MSAITIILTTKSTQKEYGLETIVKRGRKSEAKIIAPKTQEKEYQEFHIDRCGMRTYRNSMEDSLEFVRSTIEDFHRAFGANVKVEYK